MNMMALNFVYTPTLNYAHVTGLLLFIFWRMKKERCAWKTATHARDLQVENLGVKFKGDWFKHIFSWQNMTKDWAEHKSYV